MVAGSLSLYKEKRCGLPVDFVILFEDPPSSPHHYQLNSMLTPEVLSVECMYVSEYMYS